MGASNMSETTNRVQEIKNQSIWKQKNEKRTCGVEFRSADIAVLELSVRSYNCLKRAGCTTIGDVL
ncbi:MAG: DNA-directed RNA polymerase subunit alpha, partial [Clostridium sp.]|nr:DNA-directed RNA polymerase subunit alpha [Clostridium sp.]